jgi:hypothetical protein
MRINWKNDLENEEVTLSETDNWAKELVSDLNEDAAISFMVKGNRLVLGVLSEDGEMFFFDTNIVRAGELETKLDN